MSFTKFDIGQSHTTGNMDSILNMLRDENFPKFPPFLGIQTRLNSKSDRGDNFEHIHEEAPEALMSYISPSKRGLGSSRKKKGVVFRQNLEEYCATSPQRIDPEDMKSILARTAKKGILVKRISSSCQQLPETEKLRVPYIKSLLKIASNTSIDLDIEEGRREKAANANSKFQTNREEPVQNIKIPLSLPDWDGDNDASLISSQEREHLKDSAGNTPKAPSKETAKTEPDTFDTPQSERGPKRLSFSEILPTATVPNLRRNESSFAGSLNDLPANLVAITSKSHRKLLNYPEIKYKAESQNDLDRKPKPSPRIRTLKHSESSSISFNPQYLSEETNIFRHHSQPDHNQTFTPNKNVPYDYRDKPMINGYNSLTGGPKTLVTQSLKRISTPIKPQSQESNRIPDIKKVQTSTNNQMIIKTNSVGTPSRNKRTVSFSGTSSSSNVDSEPQKGIFNVNVASTGSLNNIKEVAKSKFSIQDTVCIRNENQVIFYSIRENGYRAIDAGSNSGLEGSAFCQIGADSFVLSGGVDSQVALVSSKVVLFNSVTREKEPLPGMPIARYNHATISNNKSLYILAGQSFEQKTLKSCYVFDLEKRTWLRIPSMRYERVNPHAFISSKTGNLYVFGGTDSEGNEIPWVEKFDPQRCIWQLVYNTTKFNLRSRDVTVLGNLTGRSEEILLLVKESESQKNKYRFSLLAFDTEKEIIQARSEFQFQTASPKVFGFLSQGKLYLGEKDTYDTLDVYSVENRIWTQKKFESLN